MPQARYSRLTGGHGCLSPLMPATVDSFFDEYARRYTERNEDCMTGCGGRRAPVRRRAEPRGDGALRESGSVA